ncbi:MAG: hypothetical protein R3C56_36010 [Pirellulaceae bacterium]
MNLPKRSRLGGLRANTAGATGRGAIGCHTWAPESPLAGQRPQRYGVGGDQFLENRFGDRIVVSQELVPQQLRSIPGMILVGIDELASTRSRGLFRCPQCGDTQQFRARRDRS